MVSIPSLLIRTGWRNGYRRAKEFCSARLPTSRAAPTTISTATEWTARSAHRGRGQQQITVKHVTVNADQAVVADQVVSGRANEARTAALLTSATDKLIRLIEPVQRETVWAEGEGQRKNERQPHAQSSRCTTMQSDFKAEWATLSYACRQRLEGLPNARRSRRSTKRQAEWKLPARPRTNDATNAARLISLPTRLARD
jgi:hypothetical protein